MKVTLSMASDLSKLLEDAIDAEDVDLAVRLASRDDAPGAYSPYLGWKLANLLYEKGDLDAAERECLRSRERMDTASCHLLLGYVFLARRDYARALSEFRAAIEIDSECEDAYGHVGLVYSLTDRPAEAVGWFERALEIDPYWSWGWRELGWCRFLLRDSRGAEANYGLAEEFGEPSFWLSLYRSHLHLEMGALDAALDHAEQAESIQPGDVGVACVLGDIARASGDVDGAESWYLEGIRRDESDTEPVLKLVALLRNFGRSSGADRVLADARRRMPTADELR